MLTTEARVYKSIVDLLYDKFLKGELNYYDTLGQEIAELVTIEMLPKQQKTIYSILPTGKGMAITAKEISEKTGIPTKNISSQIRNIMKSTTLIGVVDEDKNHKYFKRSIL